jgi:hypothetical protein
MAIEGKAFVVWVVMCSVLIECVVGEQSMVLLERIVKGASSVVKEGMERL